MGLGSVGLRLELEAEVDLEFEEVFLLLRYPDGTSHTQTLDVAPRNGSVSAFLGELPEGEGYEVTLSTTATNGASCSGSSEFDVVAGETTRVFLRLECGGGIAEAAVGDARIRGQIVPSQDTCPAVIARLVVSPSRAAIDVPVSIDVVPTPGPAPSVAYRADGGRISGSGTSATFRCTTEGRVAIEVEAVRAGCVHATVVEVGCFDDGAQAPDAGGGGDGATSPNAACAACTQVNCAPQLDACQNEPTSNDCLANLRCSGVGETTSCAATSSLDCYCGARSTATCIASGGNGTCADVITRTSGCEQGRPADEVPECVTDRFLDVDFGLGDAYQLVACQRRNCATHCALTP
jgi:hypothetical protein